MSCQSDSAAAAPLRCPYCGELEHGSAACSTVVLVNKGMDDIEAGRYYPVQRPAQREVDDARKE